MVGTRDKNPRKEKLVGEALRTQRTIGKFTAIKDELTDLALDGLINACFKTLTVKNGGKNYINLLIRHKKISKKKRTQLKAYVNTLNKYTIAQNDIPYLQEILEATEKKLNYLINIRKPFREASGKTLSKEDINEISQLTALKNQVEKELEYNYEILSTSNVKMIKLENEYSQSANELEQLQCKIDAVKMQTLFRILGADVYIAKEDK